MWFKDVAPSNVRDGGEFLGDVVADQSAINEPNKGEDERSALALSSACPAEMKRGQDWAE